MPRPAINALSRERVPAQRDATDFYALDLPKSAFSN
jgi:hypothetical protein